MTVPTPAEFERHLREILDRTDSEEDRHIDMDEYICKTLESLGYTDGVRVFRTTPKWYA